VLAEAGDARIVFGGDLAAGPLPAETLDRIMGLDAFSIRGNADRDLNGWAFAKLDERHRRYLADLPETAELMVEGLGRVLFCHGSPRGDEEMILKTTPDNRLREMLDGVEADVVVCGHTHMQFDRRVDRWRVVNAGSVGLPYGTSGAHWLHLGPGVEHRRTSYDAAGFAERIRGTDYPEQEQFIEENVLSVPSEAEALAFFEQLAAERYPGPS
jgi:predicted phosphodiesterase